MFQKKAAVSEQPDKAPFTCYYPHTININQRVWNQGYMDWISIDPAVKKNLALRIERRHNTGHIESVLFVKCAFKEVVVMNGISVDLSFHNITVFLDKFAELYKTCHIFILERQMPINYKSNRVAQHVLSYFMNALKNSVHLPMFYEIQASIKTKWLNAPPNLTDSTRKTWGTQFAYKLLEWRNDAFGMQVIKDNWEKPDDLADTVLQIEAVCRMLGYPATPEPPKLVELTPTIYPSIPMVAVPSFDATPTFNFNMSSSPGDRANQWSVQTTSAVPSVMFNFNNTGASILSTTSTVPINGNIITIAAPTPISVAHNGSAPLNPQFA